MNTLAETPVASHGSALSAQQFTAAPAAFAEIRSVVAPNLRKSKSRRIKDILVMIYAYGLLGFGLFFPLALAAWSAFFGPQPG